MTAPGLRYAREGFAQALSGPVLHHAPGHEPTPILKKRCAQAGLDPRTFSAHGLRSGYLTEAARRGVSLQEAMRQSRHRSVQQASSYYNEIEIEDPRPP